MLVSEESRRTVPHSLCMLQGVGEQQVQGELRQPGEGGGGHHALCRGDQQGQLPGGQWGPPQLHEQEHQQVGALWRRLMGGKVR